MQQTIGVLIVEREPLFRRGLAASLESAGDFTVVGIASDMQEAWRIADDASPDVALLGTTLPDAPGLQLANEMRRRFPAVATIVLSATENDDELFAAIRASASAYSGRNIDEEELHRFIRRAAAGEYVINEQLLEKPYVAARVLEQFRNNIRYEGQIGDSLMPLTDRELEILKRISDGMTNPEIAEVLGLREQTVKNHVTSILRKLAVNDRTQAVMAALRHGWLNLDDEPQREPGLTEKPTARLGADPNGT